MKHDNSVMVLLKDILCAPKANCLGCGSVHGFENAWLCAACQSKLSPLYMNAPYKVELCGNCGEVISKKKCPFCLRIPQITYTAVSAYEYKFPVDELIKKYKYSSVYQIAQWMGAETEKAIKAAEINDFDLIVPVPLHRHRILQRGYNQSELISFVIGKALNKQVINALCRTKNSAHQANMTEQERRKMKQVFTPLVELNHADILLVDDVRTTGTTIHNCIEALKQANAGRIFVATFASAKYNV